jgi:hypothetical protein
MDQERVCLKYDSRVRFACLIRLVFVRFRYVTSCLFMKSYTDLLALMLMLSQNTLVQMA